MSEDVQDLMELYLRGDATSSQQCRLLEALEKDDSLMEQLFNEALFEQDILRHFHMHSTEAVMRRTVAAVGKPQTRSYRKRVCKQQQRRFYQQVVPLAAVALILVTISVVLAMDTFTPQPLMHVYRSSGPASYKITQQGLQRLNSGDPIFAGERVMLEERSHAQLRYSDGSLLMCEPRTRLEFLAVHNDKLVQIDHGHVHAEVQPQSNGAMLLRSQHAEVRVIGTSFDFRVTDDASQLDVHEGAVQFSNKRGDALHISAGQSAAIDQDARLERVQRPVNYDAPWNWSITANDVEAGDWTADLVAGSTPERQAWRSVVRTLYEHHGIGSDDYWFRPPFRIHPDSIIRMRIMIEEPGFWHMFLGVQREAGRVPTMNVELQPKLPEDYPYGEWITLEFPIKDYLKIPDDRPPVDLEAINGYFCYGFFFDSQQVDVGINLESFEILRSRKRCRHHDEQNGHKD